MNLVPVSIDSIPIGQPLAFPLMDKSGTLLACKEFVIASRQDLADIATRGGGLYINVADAEARHRAYIDHLYGMVRDEKSIGAIAETQITEDIATERESAMDDRLDWLDLQTIANALLRDTQAHTFQRRLQRLQRQLVRHVQNNPDGTLFALIYLSSTDARMYSATHALLVSVICTLAAKEVLQWPEEDQRTIGLAALTMNYGMTELQDRLALQLEPPSAEQRHHIDDHASLSVAMLQKVGVHDPVWLDAIRLHHRSPPGPLATREKCDRFARLIQRADMFAARISPRAARFPMTPAAAMQASYFDENKAMDEAGAALIKAVGVYQPGAYVRLSTNEVAIVVQRGLNTTTPRVAVLLNREGLATVEPPIRDTSVREHRVVASVPHREVKVQINLERLLRFTSLPKPERL
jgi:HD-GYP domain-containing protein (c-di-GMP phosphodiesterase class II)